MLYGYPIDTHAHGSPLSCVTVMRNGQLVPNETCKLISVRFPESGVCFPPPPDCATARHVDFRSAKQSNVAESQMSANFPWKRNIPRCTMPVELVSIDCGRLTIRSMKVHHTHDKLLRLACHHVRPSFTRVQAIASYPRRHCRLL